MLSKTQDAKRRPAQLSLFEAMLDAYSSTNALSNQAMYEQIGQKLGIPKQDIEARVPVGKAATPRSTTQRTFRWMQQNLKRAGMLERAAARGTWQLTDQARRALTKAEQGVTLVAFSTKLGLALWTEGNEALWSLDEPVHALVTSPPYPNIDRAYGKFPESEYIDFITRAIEPVVEKLVPGGQIALVIGNDVYLNGLPARSLYRERLTISLCDRFGLYKMDDLIWVNPNKPPAPMQWASKQRMQLNQGYETVLWLTNDPLRARSNNQRVLQPHTESHLQLIAAGGERSSRVSSDGAYRVKKGAYGNETAGRIPRNVLNMSHNCQDQRAYKRAARSAGLPVHGAPMPLRLARFLVEFLTQPGDLVVDRFAGSLTVPKACELLGRRWMALENCLEYLAGGQSRFESAAV